MPPRKAKEVYVEDDQDEYQEYLAAPAMTSQGETKRDKRRRDIVERVERYRKDAQDRREHNFHDNIMNLHESYLSLLAQPAPTHALYLLRLHELSIQRDNMLLSAQLATERSQELAKRLYDGEVERTEAEYEEARKSIKDRLLEACTERARKLREEKDSADLNLDNLFDPQPRPHATRRRPPIPGGSRSNGSSAANAYGGPVPLPADDLGLPTLNGVEPYVNSLLPASPLLASFPLAGGGLANSANGTPYLSSLSTFAQQAAAAAATTASRGSTRKRAGPGGPGMPTIGLAGPITAPGKYEQARKCYQALTTLRYEEIQDDLETVRKKRKRGGEMRGVAAKRAAVAERDE